MSTNSSDVQTLMHIGGFSSGYEEHLRHLGQYLVPRLPELTDRFYECLLANELTCPYVERRVEQLKKAHIAWLTELFSGDYGEDFMARQRRIGEIHVAVGIPPPFVASSMSFLRSAFPNEIEIIARSLGEPIGICTGMILRLLGLCQYFIDSAYEAERMRRLTAAIGMSPALLENLIALRPVTKQKSIMG